MFKLFLVILIALAAVFPTPAHAQRYETSLMSAVSIFPGTPVYVPDGTVSHDSAWIINSQTEPNYKLTLFVLMDSVAGYAAADDSLKIEVIYGPDDATANYYHLNLTTQTLMNQQWSAGAPADSGIVLTWTPPPHNRRRYYVSNATGDTMAVSLKEYVGTDSPHKR